MAPTQTEIHLAKDIQDLRFAIHSDLISEDEMIVAQITSFNKRVIDVSIMTTPAGEAVLPLFTPRSHLHIYLSEAEGWSWGVNSLFVIIDRDDDCGLTPVEIDKLNYGEVLVSSNFESGKTILRARATRISSLSRPGSAVYNMIEKQIQNAVGRAIAQADLLSMSGLAIVAPDSISEFALISPEQIRSITVSCVIDHIKTHQLFSLGRVVCLEVTRPDMLSKTSVMSETLCRRVKDDKDCNILVCTDPLCQSILAYKPDHPSDSCHIIVVKGIPECVARAVEEINAIVHE